MKYKILLLLIAMVVTSCAPAPASTTEPGALPPDTAVTSPAQDDLSTGEPSMENPFSPQPNDLDLTRGVVFIEESGLLIRESYPPQIAYQFSGNLPTPCHQLRVEVSDPDADNKIHIDIYSVVDPDLMCTQVLKEFQESINLGTFPGGHYSVWVNGELAGEFDS